MHAYMLSIVAVPARQPSRCEQVLVAISLLTATTAPSNCTALTRSRQPSSAALPVPAVSPCIAVCSTAAPVRSIRECSRVSAAASMSGWVSAKTGARRFISSTKSSCSAAICVGAGAGGGTGPGGRGRCVSIFLDKSRRHIGKDQSKRPPKRTPRPPHRRCGHSLPPPLAAQPARCQRFPPRPHAAPPRRSLPWWCPPARQRAAPASAPPTARPERRTATGPSLSQRAENSHAHTTEAAGRQNE
jgi:hypothetical protein